MVDVDALRELVKQYHEGRYWAGRRIADAIPALLDELGSLRQDNDVLNDQIKIREAENAELRRTIEELRTAGHRAGAKR